jgi:hypothetical protein
MKLFLPLSRKWKVRQSSSAEDVATKLKRKERRGEEWYRIFKRYPMMP